MTVSSHPVEVDDERAISIVRALNHLKRREAAAREALDAANAVAESAAAAVEVAHREYEDQRVLYVMEFGIHHGHVHAAREREAAAWTAAP